jgi:hypothetical protein
MPGKVELYRAELRKRRDWEPYLKAHSGLPGPRGNLELLQAVGDEAEAGQLWRWSGSTDEYLAACGAAGLGRFAIADRKVLPRLGELASDPRWRVREGVAMALQRLGKQDMTRLLLEMEKWAGGEPYVQRAAAAGLCEPVLLKAPAQAGQVLDILDRITRSLTTSRRRGQEDFRVLRQALGYCWSVAAAAAPAKGRRLFEKWLRSADSDVAWIMKTNLTKARMSALGADWIARHKRAPAGRSRRSLPS